MMTTHAGLNLAKDATPVHAPDDEPERTHEPPDHDLDRRARGVLSTWKLRQRRSGGGESGRYPSRAIANAARGLQHPTRKLGRDVRNAIDKGVPLYRVFGFGFMWLQYARDYAKQGRRRGPWAVK